MSAAVMAFFAIALGVGVLIAFALFAPKPKPSTLSPTISTTRVADLVERMGYEIENVRGEPPEVVEIEAVDNDTSTKTTLLIRCLPKRAGRIVGRDEVVRFIEAVRDAGVNKGFLIVPNPLPADAILAADGTPVEAIDPIALDRLDQRFARA